MTLRSDYLEDFCSSISTYIAAGNRITMNSTADELGHLIVTLNFADGEAFHASMSARLADGALSHSFATAPQPEELV